MPQLVDHLADLTALRDRDSLDLAMVSTIQDLLQPQSVAICRVVGEAGNERWLTCARLQAGRSTPICDSAWAELDSLPRMAEQPLRMQAVASRQVVRAGDHPDSTVFPLGSAPDALAVLEISTLEPITEESCRLISGVLRLYVNFQGLLDYGERDALTELLNRKTFDGAFLKATLEQQHSADSVPDERRCTDEPGSYWLAMLDIDHFKHVNDNFGHLIGDEVLLLLARLMRGCFRFHDQLYRFGGEEFVVLMRCQGEAQAAAALERLRSATEKYAFPQVGRITISIGFSEIKPGDTPSGAFERADRAVYYAKEHGRNQVSSHAALVASGALIEPIANVGDVELF